MSVVFSWRMLHRYQQTVSLKLSGARDVGCFNAGRDVKIVNYHGGTSHPRLFSPVELILIYGSENAENPSNIAKWLRYPSINYKLIHDETACLRTPNTIQWLFDMQAYKDWVEGGGGKAPNLKCIGIRKSSFLSTVQINLTISLLSAGAGKTVLAYVNVCFLR